MKSKTPELLNRKAHFEYTVLDTYVAGIALIGSEVRSLRDGGGNINDAYAIVDNNEVILKNSYINAYLTEQVMYKTEPIRDRKLLLNKKEIQKIKKVVEQPGYTIIPLKMFFNEKHMVKVLIGVCVGKHEYDKREAIKKRDLERETRMKF
jgi:SsrA-binding protein